jgi:Asp-tRNA(Asn)/Glu-tRNA(Gln) amidotransferase A subunit family amidase
MSSSSLALAAVGQVLAGFVPGVSMATAVSDLSSYDAVGLANLIRTKQITSGEVIEDTIRKIEAANPELNAVIFKTYDRARQQASKPIGDGPFAGVPFLVKDNATIAGVRLTRGSRALRDNVPDKTAPFFAALEEAGFILVGVTNMPEMGLIDGTENVLYGPTHNPWNLDYSPSGSSGGSAACVAAGVLPLAHGTDGGGSIRMPASHCGLLGLKVSRGRLLPGNFAAPAWPRLVDGGLSRTVRDTAMYLSVVEDPNTQLPKLGFVSGKSPKRLKIAVMYEGMQGQSPQVEVKNAVADTARLCRELGHTVDEAKPTLDQVRLNDAARRVGAIEVAKTVDAIAKAKGITKLEDGFESRALGAREQAMRNGPFDEQIAAALPTLRAGTAALDQFFQQWDALLTPVVREAGFKIGMRDQAKFPFNELNEITRDYMPYTQLHNICGTTAMSIPLNWDSKGLPIGSQFAARMGAEATLLALAYELEEARPWASKRPPTFVT